MRIGLLVLSVGNFGKKGFYNLQEVGLARELDAFFDEVLIYRLVDKSTPESTEPLEGCRNATMTLLPAKQIGSNGIPPLDRLDNTIDCLVCFSDTQLFFPSVYRWCKKNGITLIPYIGVCRSHSGNALKQRLMSMMFQRCLRLYKKITCLAKTPVVRDDLVADGVQNVIVAPVGLDMSRLNADYDSVPAEELKQKYGFAPDDRIILFIGRMTAEKQPLLMIEIFRELLRKEPSLRLLMVGNGELSEEVRRIIESSGISQNVKRIELVANSDIWELYRISDCLLNLNRQEIYGMVLLEAMYYGCKVIAWHAPGPDYIIKDRVTGYLADSEKTICERILNSPSVADQAKAAVLSDFTWEKTASIIIDLTGQRR